MSRSTRESLFLKVPVLGRYVKYYSVFKKYVGHKALALGIISIFSTITEGVGIAAFLTYLQYLAAPNAAPSRAVSHLQNIFLQFHIPFTTVFVLGTLILVFALRGILVVIAKGYHFRVYTIMSKAVMRDLSDVFSRMQYREYLKYNSGFFSQIFTKEVPRSVVAFYQISAMVPLVVSIGIYVLFSLRLEWRFTVLAAVFGGGTALLFRTVIRQTAAISRQVSKDEAILSSLVIQLVQGFKYLFSTGSLGALRQRLAVTSDSLAAAGSRMGFLTAIPPASSETIIVLFLSAMVYFQTEVFHRPVDTMVVAMMFLYRAMRDSSVLQGSWQTFNQYVGGVDLLVNTLKELGTSAEVPGGEKFAGIHQSVELRGLEFRYGSAAVLKDIDLKISANSMVAFVGESGAGKSTLVDLLTGLMPPTKGSILVDGVNFEQLDRSTLRAQIGYVTQEGVVFDDTVANNVSLWRWQQDSEGEARVKRALRMAQCESFVEKLPRGIDEMVGERGVRLSGGQRQRLAIARELYKSPALMVLDEATSALDSESERSVQDSIDGLKGSTTIVVIAHRLATVRNCDQIFVLKNGELVERGTFNELRAKSGYFRKMCEAQSLS
jgi:ABC-type multidrug transport system fused ATPase/permease subunit